MAQRRMMSKKIIDTDAFLDMPVSARELYFQLLLRADDEGFIGNVKRIIRMIGATSDDLKILVAKGFVIPFKTGVVVITHWRIHNYIQSDRFQPTQYISEKKEIRLSDEGVYLKDISGGECIQNVSKMDTQDSIGKDSIGKDSIGSNSPTPQKATKDFNSFLNDIKDKWNEMAAKAPAIAQVKAITEERRRKLKQRFSNKDFRNNWKEAISKIGESKFMQGENKREWVVSFDWFINNNTNVIKIIEGRYDDKKKPSWAKYIKEE